MGPIRKPPMGPPLAPGPAMDPALLEAAMATGPQPPMEPPNLREAEIVGESCGDCQHFAAERGTCGQFGDAEVTEDSVCDGFAGIEMQPAAPVGPVLPGIRG